MGQKLPVAQTLEAKLDASMQAILQRGRAEYAPEDWCSLREQLRLTLLYPGRYVAFRDHYHGTGEARRLTRREVLRASRSLAAVSAFVEALPATERPGVYIDYVERSNGH